MSASFTGKVFNDLNADGIQDPGEAGLANWTVRLSGTVFPGEQTTAVTDSQGDFALDDSTGTGVQGGNGGYEAGDFWVNLDAESGYAFTQPSDGERYYLTDSPESGVNFGVQQIGGEITREVWTGVSGTTVSNLPLNRAPDLVETLSSFEAPANSDNNYGQRVRGFITAPEDGDYTFWLASDDHSELWLSTDEQRSNRQMIAGVSGHTSFREWNKFTSQKSAVITLEAGRRYYVEALMKEGGGGDNLSVGWAKPGESTASPSEVIPGAVLSSAESDPGSAGIPLLTAPVPRPQVDTGETVNFTVDATDPDGDDLYYSWRQTSGPAVDIDHPVLATPLDRPLDAPGGYASYKSGVTLTHTSAHGAPAGDEALLVESNTTLQGNYGGFRVGLSGLPISADSVYRLSYWAKGLDASGVITFSHQNGQGDNSNLSYTQAVTTDWVRYERVVKLSAQKNNLYVWSPPSNGPGYDFVMDGLKIEQIDTKTATVVAPSTPGELEFVVDINDGTNTLTRAVTVDVHVSEVVNYEVSELTDVEDGLYGSGQLSLREAIALAQDHSGPDVITFAESLLDSEGKAEIVLLDELFIDDQSVTIEGLGADRLTLRGDASSKIFRIDGVNSTQTQVVLRGLTLAGAGQGTVNNVRAVLTIDQSVLTGNSNSINGGGAINNSYGTLEVTDSAFSDNVGKIITGGYGSAYLSNVTISGNQTLGTSPQSETFFSVSFGGITLRNTTIVDNHLQADVAASSVSSDAGVIRVGAYNALTLENSIVADNVIGDTSEAVDDLFLTGGPNSLSGSHNLIGRGGNSGLIDGENGNIVGDSISPVDPQLGPLADNGGPTPTHAPLTGSPAIAAGDPAIVPSEHTTDQRGIPRLNIATGTLDIGAFQTQSEIVVDSLEDSDDGDVSPGDLSLREAIAIAASLPGADSITFNLPTGGRIVLDGTALEIQDPDGLNIIGPGADQLTIDAAGRSRILTVNSGSGPVGVSGLAMTGGRDSNANAILAAADLTVSDVFIFGSSAIIMTSPYVIGSSSGSLEVHNSTITDNDGYAILFNQTGGSVLNSTISNNRSTAPSGGVVVLNSSQPVEIINTTIVNNQGDYNGPGSDFFGAGLFSLGSVVEIHNSIVAGNTMGTSEFGSDVAGDFASNSSNNLIGVVGSSTTGLSAALNDLGVADPFAFGQEWLGELRYYGGSTPTHALLPGNNAEDAGDDSEATNAGLTNDQRGLDRIAGAAVDIGAFEAGALILETLVGGVPDTSPVLAEGGEIGLRLTPENLVGTIEIDWGDGTSKEQVDATTITEITHNYAQGGDYTVTATSFFSDPDQTVQVQETSNLISVDPAAPALSVTIPTPTPEVDEHAEFLLQLERTSIAAERISRVIIDWGDGNSIELSSSQLSALNSDPLQSLDITHRYHADSADEAGGHYTISVLAEDRSAPLEEVAEIDVTVNGIAPTFEVDLSRFGRDVGGDRIIDSGVEQFFLITRTDYAPEPGQANIDPVEWIEFELRPDYGGAEFRTTPSPSDPGETAPWPDAATINDIINQLNTQGYAEVSYVYLNDAIDHNDYDALNEIEFKIRDDDGAALQWEAQADVARVVPGNIQPIDGTNELNDIRTMVIPVDPDNGSTTTVDFIYDFRNLDPALQNEIGYYKVLDAQGTVNKPGGGTVTPNSTNWLEYQQAALDPINAVVVFDQTYEPTAAGAALAHASVDYEKLEAGDATNPTDFPYGDPYDIKRTIEVDTSTGPQRIGFYLIAGRTTAEWRSQANPLGTDGSQINAWLSFQNANADGYGHFQPTERFDHEYRPGIRQYKIEDFTTAFVNNVNIPGEDNHAYGDWDFDDAVFAVIPEGQGVVEGTIYRDDNPTNGVRDTTTVNEDEPWVVFVIDNSGSTQDKFVGSIVGVDTILDAELASARALAQSWMDDGVGDQVNVALVKFDAGFQTYAGGWQKLDLDLHSDGMDNVPNGVPDIIEFMYRGPGDTFDNADFFSGDGGSTNFNQGLTEALDLLRNPSPSNPAPEVEDLHVIFLSDGKHNVGAISAANLGANNAENVIAVGVGANSSLTQLQRVGDVSRKVLSQNELVNYVAGLIPIADGTNVFVEPGVAGFQVYIDEDGSGDLNGDEYVTLSDAEGHFALPVPHGMHELRVNNPADWALTGPFPTNPGVYAVDSTMNTIGNDFGFIPQDVGGVEGYVYGDTNRNLVWDRNELFQGEPDIIYIYDRSGSTAGQVLSDEKAAFAALNKQIIDHGYGTEASIALITMPFTGAGAIDLVPNSIAPGVQTWSWPSADRDGNGEYDTVEAINRFGSSGAENFEEALVLAKELFVAKGTAPGEGFLYFISDGQNSADVDQEVKDLQDLGINLRAFGFGGSPSGLNKLREIDPGAIMVGSNDLIGVFSGLGVNDPVEVAKPGVVVYVDQNQDGRRQETERSTTTDANGYYTFNGLVADDQVYIRVEFDPLDPHIVTSPISGTRDPLIVMNEVLPGQDFGIVRDGTPPEATAAVVGGPVQEGGLATIQIDLVPPPVGEDPPIGPFSYSFDFNGDGDFSDPQDLYRVTTNVASFTVGDGPSDIPVRVAVHDGVGQTYFVEMTPPVGGSSAPIPSLLVSVENQAPTVELGALPESVEYNALRLSQNVPSSRVPEVTVSARVFDPSEIDNVAGFVFDWTIEKDGVEHETYSRSLRLDAESPVARYAFDVDGPGVYRVVLTVTDRDGGQSVPAEQTLTVIDSSPVIVAGPTATPAPVTGLTTKLSVEATDDEGEDGLTYLWGQLSGPAVQLSVNDTGDANETEILFSEDGNYQFNVAVTDRDGNTTVGDPIDVVVVSTATRIVADSTIRIAPQSGAQTQLTAVVYDQFDEVISAAPLTWSIVPGSNGAGGSITTGGLYTAAAGVGVDVINVVSGSASLNLNMTASAADVLAGLVPEEPIQTNEGDSAALLLATFIDTESNDPLDFTVTVDWGDPGTNSQPVTPTFVSTITENNQTFYAFEVRAGFAYADPGVYDYEVLIERNAPLPVKSTTLTGGQIEANFAAISAQFVTPYGVNGEPLTNVLIATFQDDDPDGELADFTATVSWNDGTSDDTSAGPNVTINDLGGGNYEILGSHRYFGYGTPQVVIQISKAGVPDTLEIGGAAQIAQQQIDSPTGFEGNANSSSQIFLQWDIDPDIYGYIIWATNTETGVRHRIPSDETKVMNPGIWPETQKYYRADENLQPDTTYDYEIQAVNLVGPNQVVSPPTFLYSVKTEPLGQADLPAPQAFRGLHLIADDPASGVPGEGVQLYWEPQEWDNPDVVGYRVFRQVNGAQWRDLMTGELTRAIDPDSNPSEPDWLSTVDVITNSNGRNEVFNMLDPSDLNDEGLLSWFDEFGGDDGATPLSDSASPGSYFYAVVAYELNENATKPVLRSDAVIDEVLPDTTGPSMPTGLEAASYPQAIQLTWEDRPLSDDAGWGGWNVYRWAGDPNNVISEDADTSTPEVFDHHADWVKLTISPVNDTVGYNDFTAEIGKLHHYMVRAIDLLGNESDPAFASRYRSVNGEPARPTGLFGRSAGGTQIDLIWENAEIRQHVVGGELYAGDLLQGYEVEYRLAGSGDWSNVQSPSDTGAGDPSLSVTSLTAETNYEFRVRSVDVDNDFSDWVVSSVVSTGNGVQPNPVDVAGFSATLLDTGTLDTVTNTLVVEWNEPTPNGETIAGYRLYRSEPQLVGDTDSPKGFELIAAEPGYGVAGVATYTDVGSGEFSFEDSELPTNTQFAYRIYVVDTEGDISVASQKDGVKTDDSGPDIAPTLVLSNLAEDNGTPILIEADTVIRGIVDDANNDLLFWSLILRPLSGAGQDIVLGGSSTEASGDNSLELEVGQNPGVDEILGTIEPTLLQNGLYQVVLKAGDDQTGSTELPGAFINVDTDYKLGNFELPVVDIELNVPGGDSIVVRRVYDTLNVGIDNDFGDGWRLELSETKARNTAIPSGNVNDAPALREGDLVYFDVPGRGQLTFMFLPRSKNYAPNAPGQGFILNAGVTTYDPMFIAVDGSGARLETGWAEDRSGSSLLRVGKDFYARGARVLGGSIADSTFQTKYNPVRPDNNENYTIYLTDGSRHEIDTASGFLSESDDANNNITSYEENSANAGGSAEVSVERDGPSGQISKISTSPNNYVEYVYDNEGRLKTVTNAAGEVTTYEYNDIFRETHLTSVKDGRGINIVTVEYDPATGKIVRVIDAADQSANLNYSGNDGSGTAAGVQGAGSVTEQILRTTYSTQRDLRIETNRSIETIFETDGTTVSHYLVTVNVDTYMAVHGVDVYQTQRSNLNALANSTQYTPFVIDGPDTAGLRYTAEPQDHGALAASHTDYYLLVGGLAPESVAESNDWFYPASQTVLAADGVTQLTTRFSDYVNGQPGKIVDPFGNITLNVFDQTTPAETGSQNLPETIATSTGKSFARVRGNVIMTFRLDVDENVLDATGYEYTEEYAAGVTDGQLLNTYRIGAAAIDGKSIDELRQLDKGDLDDMVTDGHTQLLSENEYYTDTNQAGRLKSTTNNAGVATTYTYTADGEVKSTRNTWLGTDGTTELERSGGRTEYDNLGRVVLTIDAEGNETRTSYDTVGRTLATTDVFGGQTLSLYDLRGNLISTLYPDGTESRTVYDDLGRAVLSSERFVSSTSGYTWAEGNKELAWSDVSAVDNITNYVVTQAIYDDQGRVVETRRFDNQTISLSDATPDGTNPGIVIFTTSAPDLSSLVPFAKTETRYDQEGRVLETIEYNDLGTEDDNLRTGNVYGPGGNLLYSAPLKDGTPDDKAEFTRDDLEFYSESFSNIWNADTITLGGAIDLNDKFTLEFADHTGESVIAELTAEALLKPDGSTESPSDILGKLATAINGSSALAPYISSASTSGNRLTLAMTANNPGFLLFTSFSESTDDSDTPLFGAMSFTTTSSWTRDAAGHTVLTFSDALGRPTRTVFHDGSFTETWYSNLGEAVIDPAFDTPAAIAGLLAAGGRHVVKAETRKDPDAPIVSHEIYDVNGRLTDVWLPAVDDASTTNDPALIRPHYHYEYDAPGNQIKIIDPIGTSTAGDPNDRVTEFTYDEFGRQTSRTLPGGTAAESWTYDGLGRVRSHTDFKNQTTAYVYDDNPGAGGRLAIEYRFSAGIAAFDGSDDIITASAAERTEIDYDEFGRQDNVREYTSGTLARTTTHGYDPITGGLTLIQTPEGSVHHEYDPATGRLIRTWSAPAGATDAQAFTDTLYTYDKFGRLHTVDAVKVNGQSTGGQLTTYEYHQIGTLKSVTTPNGVTTLYEYDSLNRVEKITHFTDGAVNTNQLPDVGELLAEFVYQYHNDGNRKSAVERFDGNNDGDLTDTTDIQQLFTYEYDQLNRLIQEVFDHNNDDPNNLDPSAEDYKATYGFDLTSNRVEATKDRGNDGSVDVTTTYAYDQRDRLQSSTTDDVNNADDRHTTYTYSNAGEQESENVYRGTDSSNLTDSRRVKQTTFNYNLRGRMDGVDIETFDGAGVSTGTTSTSYTYDHRGVRVGQTIDGVETLYLVDQNNPTGYHQVLAEGEDAANGGADDGELSTAELTRSFVVGLDVIAQTAAAASAALHNLAYDAHGSTRALVDANGNFVDDAAAGLQLYSFDAYGNRLDLPGVTTSPLTNLLYSGELTDATTGLQYLRARYYDPATGRFNRVDPYAGNNQTPISLNKYLYGGGNPVLNIDPEGLFSIPELLSTISIKTILVRSLITTVANVAITNAVQYFIPKSVLDGLASAVTPSIATIGVSVSGSTSGPLRGLPVSLNAGGYVEGAVSLQKFGQSALFAGVHGGIGSSGAGAFGGDISATFGLFWGVQNSAEYAGREWNVTLPFKSLPPKVRARWIEEAVLIIARKNQVIGPAIGVWDSQKIGKFNKQQINNAVDKIAPTIQALNNLSVTVSWGAGDASYFGLTLGLSLKSSSGRAPSSFGGSLAWQILPSSGHSVSFS